MALPEYRMPISARTIDAFLPRSEDWQQIDLNAPYQRDSVWDDTRRRNLIRSILMGVPIGAVIVSQLPHRIDNPDGAYWRVVDGKQRIETLRGFANDEFTAPVDWWPHLRRDLAAELASLTDEIEAADNGAALERVTARHHELQARVNRIVRTGEVVFSDLSKPDQREFRGKTIAVCEVKLDSTSQWVSEGTPGARLAAGGWILDTARSDDEILAAEAELYLLINRGGVPHADSDLDTARTIAERN